MEEKEKIYTLKISEKELKNALVKKALVALISSRVKFQKGKKYLVVSAVEAMILAKHYSWADVNLYAPNKKDRLKGEVGKVNGKRVCVRGKK